MTARTYDFAAGELLLIDKPHGWTSFDVVNRIRYQVKRVVPGKPKVGHAGTLDPLATGLLILCTGKFTKQIDSYQAQEKEYTGTFVLGATTPCCDLELPVDAWWPTAHLTDAHLQEATVPFTGPILQVPPVFSAVRVGGKRAYEHARAGRETTMPPRQVDVSEFELTRITRTTSALNPGHALIEVDFRIVCSKGTYIRSLARDFGLALGSGAHLSALRRTRIGAFRVEDGITPAQFIELVNQLTASQGVLPADQQAT